MVVYIIPYTSFVRSKFYCVASHQEDSCLSSFHFQCAAIFFCSLFPYSASPSPFLFHHFSLSLMVLFDLQYLFVCIFAHSFWQWIHCLARSPIKRYTIKPSFCIYRQRKFGFLCMQSIFHCLTIAKDCESVPFFPFVLVLYLSLSFSFYPFTLTMSVPSLFSNQFRSTSFCQCNSCCVSSYNTSLFIVSWFSCHIHLNYSQLTFCFSVHTACDNFCFRYFLFI